MGNGDVKVKTCVVTVREDYVIRDPDKVKEILQRVSEIVSKSYQRKQSA